MKIILAQPHTAAARWESTYRDKEGKWTYGPDKEKIHAKLLALGDNPTHEAVAKAIGNESWSYLSCGECNADVKVALELGDSETFKLCAPCARAAAAAMGAVKDLLK